jgi:hypothetical protein
MNAVHEQCSAVKFQDSYEALACACIHVAATMSLWRRAEDKEMFGLWVCGTGGMVVGTCPLLCPAEVAVSTVRGLLSMIQPEAIIVMTEMHSQAISKSSLQEVQHEFCCLGTSGTSVIPGLQELPAGCTITDMAAAVLSAAEVCINNHSLHLLTILILEPMRCYLEHRTVRNQRFLAKVSVVQARRIPAVAIINVIERAFTDVTRKHLSMLSSQVSLAAKACASNVEVRILHEAACEAQLRAPWDASRVYL